MPPAVMADISALESERGSAAEPPARTANILAAIGNPTLL
jgi:hypothetical protein